MVAVLAESHHRSEAEHRREHPRLIVIGASPARRPAGGVARRCSAPAVSARVAASRRAAAVLAALAVVVMSILFALQAALGGGAGGPLTTGAASAGARPVAAHAWMVRPGDTLWSIAVDVQHHGDVRPLVDRLSAQVGGQPLMVGQRLMLP